MYVHVHKEIRVHVIVYTGRCVYVRDYINYRLCMYSKKFEK